MSNKINLIVRLQRWMDSVPGQTFLNYAYSWGASIVIAGALFKLTHLPGGNLMLFLGMGTEIIVFFLSAFDRPFDKQEADRELAAGVVGVGLPAAGDVAALEAAAPVEGGSVAAFGAPVAGSTIIIGGGAAGVTPGAAPETAPDAVPVPEETLSEEVEAATKSYVEKLTELNETLARVNEQNLKLTRDSEEMENLNRTLTGINKVYELHLKSISLQVGTIDDINAQTQKLAEQIQRLNQVYGRMIEALTVNVVRNGGSVPQEPSAE